jgi:hypothetical protein
MRHTFLILLALLLVPNASAQEYAIDKGSFLLGGTVGFSSQGSESSAFEGDEDRIAQALINTSFRYFVAPGFALGVNALVSSTTQGDVTVSDATVGPSLSLYFGQPTSIVYPFISGTVGFSTLSVEVDDVGSDSVNGALLGLEGGISYMIARNVALTGSLYYQRQGFSDSGESVTNDVFGFQGGVTAFIF